MAEELYAPKLDISDDRVKELSTVESTFTQKAYAESGVLFSKDAGVQIENKKLSLKESYARGYISLEQYLKSVSKLEQMTKAEYEAREQQAAQLKEDLARTTDERAAAEILEKIAQLKKVEKEAEIKYYASSYLDHIVRAVKISLIKVDESVTKEKQEELDKRIKALKILNSNVIVKYSKVKTFADRLLSISNDLNAKKLSEPVRQEATFEYGSL